MPVVHQGNTPVPIHRRIAKAKLRGTGGVALHTDAEHLALHTGFDHGKVERLGQDLVDGFLIALSGAQAVGGNVLKPSPVQIFMVQTCCSSCAKYEEMRTQAFPCSIQNRRVASLGLDQGQGIAHGMGKEGGVKSAPRPCFLQNSTQGAKCLGSSRSRSTHSPGAKNGIAGMQV